MGKKKLIYLLYSDFDIFWECVKLCLKILMVTKVLNPVKSKKFQLTFRHFSIKAEPVSKLLIQIELKCAYKKRHTFLIGLQFLSVTTN